MGKFPYMNPDTYDFEAMFDECEVFKCPFLEFMKTFIDTILVLLMFFILIFKIIFTSIFKFKD